MTKVWIVQTLYVDDAGQVQETGIDAVYTDKKAAIAKAREASKRYANYVTYDGLTVRYALTQWNVNNINGGHLEVIGKFVGGNCVTYG